MTDQVKAIIEKHKERVRVCCDEYHAHTAGKGCLTGTGDAVDVMILAEYIYKLESKIKDLSDTANATGL